MYIAAKSSLQLASRRCQARRQSINSLVKMERKLTTKIERDELWRMHRFVGQKASGREAGYVDAALRDPMNVAGH